MSYPVHQRDSHTILTEKLELHKRGALPLFYETLTGAALPATRKIMMRDVYPFVNTIGAEYRLATQQHNCIQTFRRGFQKHKKRKGHSTVTLTLVRKDGDSHQYQPRDFKALRQFKKDPSHPDVFLGRAVPDHTAFTAPVFRGQFNPVMIYECLSTDDTFTTPASSKHLLMPEEIPIFLLFFHMSSVVRYKPEFLLRIRGSRYWPMLVAARRHCILRMLILTWSFVHRRNLFLKHDLNV